MASKCYFFYLDCQSWNLSDGGEWGVKLKLCKTCDKHGKKTVHTFLTFQFLVTKRK